MRKFGCVSWLSSQAFDGKRENWWQVLSLRFIFSDFFSCSWPPSLFHVYKDIWKPSICDNLACEREFDNCFDKFAVKVVNNGETVGLLLWKLSNIAWYRFYFILVFWGWFMENNKFFSQMFSQISRTPDFEQSFRGKKVRLICQCLWWSLHPPPPPPQSKRTPVKYQNDPSVPAASFFLLISSGNL